MTSYALPDWNFVRTTAVIGAATFALSVGTRLVEAAMTDPQFGFIKLIKTSFSQERR